MRTSTAVCGTVLFVAGLLAGGPTAVAAAPPPPAGNQAPDLSQERAVAAADLSIRDHPAAISGSSGDAYTVTRVVVEADGSAHVRYRRTHHGLPVLGGDFVVHTAPGGGFVGATSALSVPLSLASTKATVPSARAADTARGRFVGTVAEVGVPRLVVDATSGAGHLAWETVVSGTNGQTPSVLHVLSDAAGGVVTGAFDEVKTVAAVTTPAGVGAAAGTTGPPQGTQVAGTGNSIYSGAVPVDTTLSAGTYRMVDPARGNGTTCDLNQTSSACTVFTDPDNIWGNGTRFDRQSAGADAHYGAALTYDYFANVHRRNGIFGDGRGVLSRVHYGNSYANAFWDGTQMTYGDGAGNARPLVSIDIAGHEMGHGITANIIPGGLVYAGEPGGLNESASDIWGSMVEFYAANAADPGDYTIGEKIDINGNGTPLRYMYDPKLDGASKNCWFGAVGGIDVHYSSGIGNLAYFLVAEGSGVTAHGTAPTCDGSVVTGQGRVRAERIWYRAMDLYFTSTTRYVTAGSNDARAATLSAAADLFGRCSAEYVTVQKAWTAVSVAGEDAACPRTTVAAQAAFDGDGLGDIGVTGGFGWTGLPVARSTGNGGFAVTSPAVGPFAAWAARPGVRVLNHDVNGDGRTDIILTGVPGWTGLPVARSNGDGTFTVTSAAVGSFASWAATPGARAMVRDFNGDGRADIALAGGPGWTTVPVALGNGNGTFTVVNAPIGEFATLAADARATILPRDFNGDGRTDLALVGIPGRTTLPLALSDGDGTFTVSYPEVGSFAEWAALPGVRILPGNLNGDRGADLALTVPGWTSLPVAMSRSDGTFTVTNLPVAGFAEWAAVPNVTVVTAGDVNGDGRADLALTGGPWSTLPVAMSNGDGTFAVTNAAIAGFGTWAAVPGVTVVARDVNGDGRLDLALTGGPGWGSLPVAMSNGNGTFTVVNAGSGNFQAWAAAPGAVII